MPQDLEKKRARDKKYRDSKKGKATRQSYLKSRKTELVEKTAKKKEEEALQRAVAFWKKALRRDGKLPHTQIYNIIRLWHMRKRGEDIDFDPHNARYVYEYENQGRFEKKEKEPGVKSMDYY